jgi:hypothetical protein
VLEVGHLIHIRHTSIPEKNLTTSLLKLPLSIAGALRNAFHSQIFTVKNRATFFA